MKKNIKNEAQPNTVSVQDRLEKARMNDKKVQEKNYSFNQGVKKNNTMVYFSINFLFYHWFNEFSIKFW